MQRVKPSPTQEEDDSVSEPEAQQNSDPAKTVTARDIRAQTRNQIRLRAKIQAVQDAPAPTTVSKLRTFLGLVNYYGKLIPNLSTMLAPLRILLRKGAKWKWGSDQVRAFKAVKATLKESKCSFDFDLLGESSLNCAPIVNIKLW